MSTPKPPVYRGRSLGIITLVAFQLSIGAIHVVFGFLFALFVYSGPDIYGVYTLTFGLLTLIFTYALWFGRRSGWIGTVSVSTFVIVLDLLTLFDLPSIPGIPRMATVGEIGYSILILAYLLQDNVQAMFTKTNLNK